MSDGDGRRALRAYLEAELATADDELAGESPWGLALPPTYSGNCWCGASYFRDEKLCRKHARERLAELGVVKGE